MAVIILFKANRHPDFPNNLDDEVGNLINVMVSCESNCLPSIKSFKSVFGNASDESFHDLIKRTQIKDRKFRILKISKAKYEKLIEELDACDDNGCRYDLGWEWNKGLNKYVKKEPILGEYDPIHKRVILYMENIKDACARDGVPFYCGVLTTFIHELFHAVHYVEADNGGRFYNTIREIEEAMTEFSTLVFLKEMVDDYPKTKEWQKTFEWAQNSIREKKRYLGDLPAYGFGHYLYDTLYYNHKADEEAYKWIERYNQKIGDIDKKNRYVKWYQQMLNPKYPFKDEQLCRELLHSILFNL